MRTALLLVLALPGCSETPGEARVECRLGDAAAFERICTLEARDTERGRELIVRRPDGGFRRLLAADDSVDAADGAEQPRVTRSADGRIEVEIGGDAYRLPPSVGR